MSATVETSNLNWTTNLRVLATISVIFVHVACDILYKYGNISNFVWWTGNVYDSIVRFCVPIFLMLTGALMLNKKYELGDFLKKKFSRIILPFLFWSFFYVLLALRDASLVHPEMSLLEGSKLALNLIATGSSFHLWYIYMIIGIYLFMPILSKWVQNANEKEILYFIAIWVFTLFLNQPIFREFRINVDFTYFAGFLGYLILGYYLSIKSFKYDVKTLKQISLLLFFLGIIVTIFGTYFLSVAENRFNEYFYGGLTFNIVIVSAGLFIYFKNSKISNPVLVQIINFINTYSYGIYLVHILVLRFLVSLGIDYDFINPVLAIPITSALCLSISALIIYCVNKLPYGKYISG
ncbi:acyltransferase family protein [Flavobacterium sp. Fl-318]|uniref:Acyltransferase family protein n=1 Tax=Flavobacterium cupriresistens TaxID=2893885 RepID=A0ABU4RGJ9_9FLAO|nr:MULTISPECIES: acyltransferase family protein [unclassified Flavobacterium]MDX6190824.1 acyltransferase family protein [Flavobacterium sp. Fl-318]UFH44003.1 acyltransferase family protein [Flavobacterium sp. F-323]